MADYVGAIAAIKTRLVENWTTTQVAYANESALNPVDDNGNPVPWVFCEIVSDGSEIVGTGVPANQTIRYDGMIKLHVMVPIGTGIETGFTHAVALGEIFRNQLLYTATAGRYVRTWVPRISEGDANSEDGLWFSVTTTIDFEYWHRG